MFAVIIISYALAGAAVAGLIGVFEYGVVPVLVTKAAVGSSFSGELGPLSPSYGPGLFIDERGDNVGQRILALTKVCPALGWMEGKVFYIKEAEAVMVIKLVEAVEANPYLDAVRILNAQEDNTEGEQEAVIREMSFRAVSPLSHYFWEFPEDRTADMASLG